MNFNENQVNGIEHFMGPCQVLAGPGSGKTATIVNRIHNLIYKHHVKPEEILVITFTKAAALEMEHRFVQLMGGQKKPVTFGTFHSVFYSILRNTYKFNSSNIFTEKEKIKLIEEIVKSKDIEMLSDEDFFREIIADIGIIKNNGIELEDFVPGSISGRLFTEIYNDYEELRKNAKKIDFDDMLVLCFELLTSREYVLQ
jgi:DNA helicase-2/ATP-dependent DNA helicase PcrA